MSSTLKQKSSSSKATHNSTATDATDTSSSKQKMTAPPEDDDSNKKQGFFAAYQSLMVRYPLPMNALQSALIGGLAVVISQHVTHGKVVDVTEIQVMMLINVIYHTPILMTFYTFLNALKFNMFITLIIDQLLFSPLFTAGIIGLRMFLRGGEVSAIPQVIIDIVPNAMKSSWSFWIPIRFLILKFVPIPLQLVAGSLAALVWNVIFSMILNAQK